MEPKFIPLHTRTREKLGECLPGTASASIRTSRDRSELQFLLAGIAPSAIPEVPKAASRTGNPAFRPAKARRPDARIARTVRETQHHTPYKRDMIVPTMPSGDWTWLEIAKLIAGLITPAALALFGILIHRMTKGFELHQWRNQKLIEKRLEIYGSLAPELNDLLCYFMHIGLWKELEPPAVVAVKRTVDKKIYLAAPLFSSEFFSACQCFLHLCFETYNGWGINARLRTSPARRSQAFGDKWKTEWNAFFSDKASDPKQIREAYQTIMNVFAKDIGIHEDYTIPPAGRVPQNVQPGFLSGLDLSSMAVGTSGNIDVSKAEAQQAHQYQMQQEFQQQMNMLEEKFQSVSSAQAAVHRATVSVLRNNTEPPATKE
jgi:hypothetical protein